MINTKQKHSVNSALMRLTASFLLALFSFNSLYAAEIIVNTLENDLATEIDKCKLNQAVTSANNNASPAGTNCISGESAVRDNIIFKIPVSELPPANSPAIINMNEELKITENIHIDGSLLDENGDNQGTNITLNSGGGPRHFNLSNYSDSEIRNLNLEDGSGNVTPVGPNNIFGGGSIAITEQSKLTLDNVNISNSVVSGGSGGGGAIYLEEDTSLTLNNSILENNRSINYAGGAIDLGYRAFLESNNSSFLNNDADSNGAAIFAHGDSNINLNSTNFEDNQADLNGGAIYLGADSNLNISNGHFENNKALTYGGAIYIGKNNSNDGDQTYLDINNSSSFINNSAATGGAILVDSNAQTNQRDIYIKDTLFENNQADSVGGAIELLNQGINLNVSNSQFLGNKANSVGGAISANYINSFYIEDSLFENNSTSHGEEITGIYSAGGAIYLYSATSNLIARIFRTDFINNVSKLAGGAIYSMGTGLEIIGDANNKNLFEGNKVIQGLNDTGADGGAINLTSNLNNSRIENYQFIDNTAGIDNQGEIINLNSSSNGGAIYSLGDLELNFVDFIGNIAAKTAGALNHRGIYSPDGNHQGRLNINNSRFENNHSSFSAGALNFNNLSEINIHFSEFIDNSVGDGTTTFSQFLDQNTIYQGASGAIGGLMAKSLFISDSIFDGNSSDIIGGAIGLTLIDSLYIANTQFLNNVSTVGGAVAFSLITEGMMIEDSHFENNQASAGGAVFNILAPMQILSSSFVKNKTIISNIPDYQLLSQAYNIDSQAGGGAIFTAGLFSLLNNTFSENSSETKGGAVQGQGGNIPGAPSLPAIFLFASNTFHKNIANISGGAVELNQQIDNANFVTSIFSKNQAPIAENCQVNDTSLVIGNFNVFDKNSNCSVGADDRLNQAALLLPLAENADTKTSYHTISEKSPAYQLLDVINKGQEVIDYLEASLALYLPPDALPIVLQQMTSSLTIDQINRPRGVNGFSSIGSIERESVDPDFTFPEIAEVTPAPASTTDTTVNYTFSSTLAGEISYSGSCGNGNISNAGAGNNTIAFGPLAADQIYSDCTIVVTSPEDLFSNTLNISAFEIKTAPVDPVDPVQPSGNNGSSSGAGGPYGQEATKTEIQEPENLVTDEKDSIQPSENNSISNESVTQTAEPKQLAEPTPTKMPEIGGPDKEVVYKVDSSESTTQQLHPSSQTEIVDAIAGHQQDTGDQQEAVDQQEEPSLTSEIFSDNTNEKIPSLDVDSISEGLEQDIEIVEAIEENSTNNYLWLLLIGLLGFSIAAIGNSRQKKSKQ